MPGPENRNVDDQATLRLMKGTVDVLILKALACFPTHGYGVSTWIHEQTGGELGMKDAALYQALHRLEHRGWVESDWGTSENNRRAKYYQLTPKGRAQLVTEEKAWRRYAEAVFRVLEATS